jgi:hypothetical protein
LFYGARFGRLGGPFVQFFVFCAEKCQIPLIQVNGVKSFDFIYNMAKKIIFSDFALTFLRKIAHFCCLGAQLFFPLVT